jgi:hypothetical protein
MSKKYRRPTDEEYKYEAMHIRLRHAPTVYPCMKCGWPVRHGFCCETCGDNNPSEPREAQGGKP